MNGGKLRFALGCVVAPLTAPVLAMVVILLFAESVGGRPVTFELTLDDFIDLIALVGLFLMAGAPIAYAIMIFLGLPFYFLARQLGWINFWTVTFGSALVAVLPSLIMVGQNSLGFFASIALIGYGVGLTFWFVSGLHKRQPNQKRGRCFRQQKVSDQPEGLTRWSWTTSVK